MRECEPLHKINVENRMRPEYPLTSATGHLLRLACCLVLVVAGCTQPPDATDASAKERPLEGVTLRLAVADDPELAVAVEKLRGEWKAQSGSELEVTRISGQELLAAKSLDADAAIVASHLLGPLAEGGLVAPMPDDVLRDDDAQWGEIFELQRSREVVWGSATYAVPFGSPVLACYCRADILEKLGRQPPKTWAEYQKLVEMLSDRAKLGELAPPEGTPWAATREPLGPGWAGLTFLARAVSAAKHPDNYSTLFNIETMEPLIDSPPMLRALAELVAATKGGPAEQFHDGPAEVRGAFWRGECALALSWPTAAAKLPDDAKKSLAVTVAELPGSDEVYNIDERVWVARDKDQEREVPLLATAGRIGVIARESRHPQGAAALLLWLSGTELGSPPSARSMSTTLFRQSHLKKPQIWVESPMSPAAAGAYADLTKATLERRQAVFALRIPGRAEYLAALDEAVRAAVKGEKAPAAALRDAATRWREITDKLGVERQRRAYLHSLALEP